MRYPAGMSHTSDGDDVLTPAHGRAQAAFGAESAGKDQGATFTPVEPALSRALHRAARGHTARAARRYTQPPPPTARVAEVVPAPARASASGRTTADGRPALMWTGACGVVLLLGAGAWRARRR